MEVITDEIEPHFYNRFGVFCLGYQHKPRKIEGEKDEAFYIEIQHRFSYPFYDFNTRFFRPAQYVG